MCHQLFHFRSHKITSKIFADSFWMHIAQLKFLDVAFLILQTAVGFRSFLLALKLRQLLKLEMCSPLLWAPCVLFCHCSTIHCWIVMWFECTPIFTAMDRTAHSGFKRLLIDFHAAWKWMKTSGCLQQRKKVYLVSLQRVSCYTHVMCCKWAESKQE